MAKMTRFDVVENLNLRLIHNLKITRFWPKFDPEKAIYTLVFPK